MTRVKSILVPTDFSEPSLAAWSDARWLATRLGAQIHLLHVISPPALFDAWGTDGLALRMADLIEDGERIARARLQAMVPKSGPLARRVRIATAVGTPVESILDYVKTQDVDLIVMGTHGRGAIGHMLLGSVAERCVQRATVPVLTAHARATAPTRPAKRRPASRHDAPVVPHVEK